MLFLSFTYSKAITTQDSMAFIPHKLIESSATLPSLYVLLKTPQGHY